MKGFVYLIEVAIAGLLAALALTAFLSTTSVKTDWGRPDLISLGDSMLGSLIASGQMTGLLEGDTSNMSRAMPPNLRWALQVSNTPKNNINIGCVCDVANYTRLKDDIIVPTVPTYFNGRMIKFAINITQWPAPDVNNYDVMIFTNTNIDFDNDNDVKNYLAAGHGIIAVANIDGAGMLGRMNDTFGITTAVGSPPIILPFRQYSPTTSKISKYFFGFGMPVTKFYAISDNKVQGTWTMEGQNNEVNITTGNTIEIQNALPHTVAEGDKFVLELGTMGSYPMKVKKILPERSGVIFQAIAPNFDFHNLTTDDGYAVKATAVNVVGNDQFSGAATSGSAVWISYFSTSSEYGALLRATAGSLVTDWWVVEPVTPQNPATAAAFIPLYGDIPETARIVLWLWYAF